MDLALYKQKDWLYEQYVTNMKTQYEISKLCNVTVTTIQSWVKKFNLKYEGTKRISLTKEKITCDFCGKDFYLTPAQAKQRVGKHKFCSKKCSDEYRRIHRDEYVYTNIKSDVTLTCENCHNVYSIPLSIYKVALKRDYKHNFCSPECRGKKVRGENHFGYFKDRDQLQNKLKSIRWSVDMQEWKQNVLKRDNYTCYECGAKTDLVVHHIVTVAANFDKSLDIDNGITLCTTCHKKTLKHETDFEKEYQNYVNKIETDKQHGRSRVSGQKGKGH